MNIWFTAVWLGWFEVYNLVSRELRQLARMKREIPQKSCPVQIHRPPTWPSQSDWCPIFSTNQKWLFSHKFCMRPCQWPTTTSPKFGQKVEKRLAVWPKQYFYTLFRRWNDWQCLVTRVYGIHNAMFCLVTGIRMYNIHCIFYWQFKTWLSGKH